MNYRHHAFLFLAVGLGLVACSEDNPWLGPDGEGGINLSLSTDGTVKRANPHVRSTELFTVPAADDFSIRLEKTDGSYSHTFETLSDFVAHGSFSTGAYRLTAFYGNPEDEGFECPNFEGTADLTVLEGRTTDVAVTATVSNSLVSISYTDSFKEYLSDYSATVHSEGHSYIEISGDETRPAFIAPGEVALSVSFSNPHGQSVTLQPATFAALAGHHYNITLDVNHGEVGVAQLNVIFDDSLECEDVVIDLTDELFTSAAPAVKPVGFSSGDMLEFLSGESASDGKLRFNVIAHGGMKDVMLTIASNDFTPAFGKEINLIGADAAAQSQLAQLGIDVKGLYNNPDRMAIVDITELPKHLPAGEYEISVLAKDMFTRVSEPVTLRLVAVATHLDVTPQSALFGLNTASLSVAYNGSTPQESISFKALNRYGNYEDCRILSVTDATRTRSIETKNYLFTIELPDTERSVIPVKVYLYGNEINTVNIPVEMPQYSVEVDPFATSAKIKVVADASQIAVITDALRVFDGETAIAPARIKRFADKGLVEVTGLNPSTGYNLSVTLLSVLDDAAKKLPFTTEKAELIPNGAFSDLKETINIGSINTGGTYSGTVGIMRTYQIKSSILVNEAEGWGSINSTTCSLSSNPMNTWFCAPSTFVENGRATVRSVGYNHAGTLPGRYQKTGVYYNINAPAFSDADKAAGQMYLITTATGAEGVAFGSRPASLSFDYTYSPLDNESARVTVEVLNASGSVISTVAANLGATSSVTKTTVALPDYAFGSRAAMLRVKFVSSTASVPAIHIPTGSELDEGVGVSNFTNPPAVATNKYKAIAVGSVLTLGNLRLNY